MLPSLLLAVVFTLTAGLLLAYRRQARFKAAAVAERQRTDEQLEQSDLRFRILTRATNDAVWDWNVETDSVWWNRNVQTLFGYTEEEVNPTSGWRVEHIHPDDRESVLNSVQTRMRSHEGFWSSEYRFRRADGTYANILDRGYILRDHDARPVRMIGSMMDISKQKREMELARSRDAALESARLKSQFLANMSHEIRTPMNSVIGMTDILLNTDVTSEQREFLEIVRMSAESLLTIINDILDFSKIEAGKLKFEMLDFEPRTVIEETTTLLVEQAHDKRLQLSSSIDADVPESVRGDPGRLRQVLVNLVGNAIKFTSEGGVTIRVKHDEETESHLMLRFEVTDTGIGIPSEARACLFQPFSQVDASTTRKYGGTGLGLAISKQLVNLMAGQIGCESTGQGSTFWFTARFEKVGAAKSSPEASSTGAPEIPRALRSIILPEQRRRTRILVAEDNPFNQKVVQRQLREMGFGVDAVADGIEVLEAMKRIPYDVVLMDCQMPEMDGYACAAEIRRREDNARHVPIIAMTAHVRKEDRDKCLAAGMDDFLSKPVRAPQLQDALTRWLCATSKATLAPVDSNTAREPVDLEIFLEVAGNNMQRLQELADRYVTQTTLQLAKLRDAVATGAAAEIKCIAHSAAGSSAMCGMTHLVELLRDLEQCGHDGRLARTPGLYSEIETEFERIKRALSEVNYEANSDCRR